MIISRLENESNIYINIHAEQVFASLFLDAEISAISDIDSDYENIVKKGIYQHTLTAPTVDIILKEMGSVNKNTIFLDFDKILNFPNNVSKQIIDFIAKMKKNANNVIIYNLNSTLFDELKKHSTDFKETYDGETQSFKMYFLINDNDKSYYNDKFISNSLFEETLKHKLKEATKTNKSNKLSSRVRLGKYINIKEIIHNKTFFCFCIYNFTRKMLKMNFLDKNYENNKDKCLLIHTMNSSSIGSLLAQLLCLDMVFLDHLGPLNRLYNTSFKNTIEKNKKYIVVADVICLGTELSNAKSILNFLNAEYIGCISFVDILTTDNSTSEEICSLFTISNQNNHIEYTIETDLCDICSKKQSKEVSACQH